MDPRAVLLLALLTVTYSCYFVVSFLSAEDEEGDTDLHYFTVGIALAVMLWALLLGLPVLLALLWSMVLPGYRMRFRHIPGYSGWPLLGNLLQVKKSWHGAHEAGAARFGPVFKLWYGAEPHVVVASAQACKQVVAKCPMTPEFPVPFWGDDRQVLLGGLPFARDMAYHKVLRSAWAPAFSPSSLAGYHPIMVHHADQLVGYLGEVAGSGGSVELWRLLTRTSMAVVCASGFGVDTDPDLGERHRGRGAAHRTAISPASEQPPAAAAAAKAPPSSTLSKGSRVMNAFQVVLDCSQPSKTGFWLPVFLMMHPGLRGPVRALANLLPDAAMARLKAAQREIRDVAWALIHEERRQQQKQQKEKQEQQQQQQQQQQEQEQEQQQQGCGIKAGSFLKHLLHFQDKATSGHLSDADVVANVYAFLGGGVETPANAVTYTIYQLAMHPDCEARVLKELDAASPSLYDQPLPPEALPYLQACINEAMRTMTPVSKIFRQATEDTTLVGAKLAVKKGTKFQVSLRCAMRDPSAWKEPLEFKPERFLPDDVEWYNTDASAFMPFGGGSRMCIGMKFALHLVKLVLAKLYSRYTFELEPGVAPLQLATGITMVPEDGMRVRVHARL